MTRRDGALLERRFTSFLLAIHPSDCSFPIQVKRVEEMKVQLLTEKGHFPTGVIIDDERFTLGSPHPVLSNHRLPRMKGFISKVVYVPGFGPAHFIRAGKAFE